MKRYILSYLACAALIAGAFLCNALYLRNSGEGDVRGVMQTVMGGESCLAGSAVRNSWPYKAAGYEIAKPDILAVGSSRVMQLRQSFFNVPFFNAGASEQRSVPALREAVEIFTAQHKPELIIIALDFFWFNPAYTEANNALDTAPRAELGLHKDILQLLQKPFAWLAEGKITPGDYIRGLLHSYKNAQPCRAGVQAQKLDKGFAADGSHYNVALVSGRERAEDFRFSKIRASIEKGASGGRFAYGTTIDPALVVMLGDMIAGLQKQGIEVLVFLAPVSPAIRDEIAARGTDYAYIADLRAALKTLPVPVFDFYDPSAIPADDCEFLDGYHGGDLTYAKMTLAMAQGPEIRPYIAVDRLRQMASAHKGVALMPGHGFSNAPEIDFLGIGCKKTRN